MTFKTPHTNEPADVAPAPNWSAAALTVLGLVGLHPMSGYDIKQKAEETISEFWALSYGQIYPRLRELEEGGLVEAVRPASPHGPRIRKEYRITAAGRRTLHSWLHRESEPVRYRDEELAKLLLTGPLDPDHSFALIRSRRDRAAAALAAVEAGAEAARRASPAAAPAGQELPHLVAEFGIGQLRAEIAWCEHAIQRLSNAPAPDSTP
ncbi:helix-turn-helix transcriptional regulator [Streptomyces vinaceus]|uniref:helix-turn-helix transcriptional regulator n=1 Tax=Streptomyces vinaceus TaxID=1960 RepID=UPI003807F79D